MKFRSTWTPNASGWSQDEETYVIGTSWEDVDVTLPTSHISAQNKCLDSSRYKHQSKRNQIRSVTKPYAVRRLLFLDESAESRGPRPVGRDTETDPRSQNSIQNIGDDFRRADIEPLISR